MEVWTWAIRTPVWGGPLPCLTITPNTTMPNAYSLWLSREVAYSLWLSREVVEVVDDAVLEDVPAHLPRDTVRVRAGVRVVGMPLPCL